MRVSVHRERMALRLAENLFCFKGSQCPAIDVYVFQQLMCCTVYDIVMFCCVSLGSESFIRTDEPSNCVLTLEWRDKMLPLIDMIDSQEIVRSFLPTPCGQRDPSSQ